MSNIILNETITRLSDYQGHWHGEAFITHHTYGEQAHRFRGDAERWNSAQRALRPAPHGAACPDCPLPKEQLWAAYEAACEARHAHIHVERCETCWAARTSSCQGWNELTSQVNVARDRWIACEE